MPTPPTVETDPRADHSTTRGAGAGAAGGSGTRVIVALEPQAISKLSAAAQPHALLPRSIDVLQRAQRRCVTYQRGPQLMSVRISRRCSRSPAR